MNALFTLSLIDPAAFALLDTTKRHHPGNEDKILKTSQNIAATEDFLFCVEG